MLTIWEIDNQNSWWISGNQATRNTTVRWECQGDTNKDLPNESIFVQKDVQGEWT